MLALFLSLMLSAPQPISAVTSTRTSDLKTAREWQLWTAGNLLEADLSKCERARFDCGRKLDLCHTASAAVVIVEAEQPDDPTPWIIGAIATALALLGGAVLW
jgi:hypothetical protein